MALDDDGALVGLASPASLGGLYRWEPDATIPGLKFFAPQGTIWLWVSQNHTLDISPEGQWNCISL